jgi:hypothetical protein
MNPAPKSLTIKLALGIPTELTPVSSGMEVSGNYGPQMMFNLAGNQRLYVPPPVGEEIRSLSLARGASFTITKSQRDGSRSFDWKVERTPASVPANAPPSSSRPATQLESALKTAIAAAHEAEKYGTMIGYVVRFSEESIKCMAITALIGMQQRG